jgi:hypothetical protein
MNKLTLRLLAAAALVICSVGAIPRAAQAEGPGITVFGGVKGEDSLDYRLDFGGKSGSWDRYRLRIPAKKMKVAVQSFTITYPDYYKGKFNTKEVEVLVRNKPVKLQEVNWNKDNYLLEIFPEEPVPAGEKVEIILSDVRNPSFGGMFNFGCQIESPGDIPLLRLLGIWSITIQ